MLLTKYSKDFEKIAGEWIKDVELYSDEQFQRKPDEHQWSIGQVYVHLVQSALNYHIGQIRQCAEKKGTEIRGGKKMPGRISYFLGTIPPVRVHVPPSSAYTPAQPVSKEEIKERLKSVIQSVNDIREVAEQASVTHKTAHPGFGYLNAQEWYRLIPMHYRHHRRQQKRLNEFLGVRS
ncbi:MAG: DinB family protein [Bacteroidetes bacterium]|nr:DinB family protein [Bacteroidota bacterium]